MSSITGLPDSFKAGLKELAEAPPEFFTDLIDGLNFANPTFSISKLAESVSTIKGLDKKKVGQIFYSIGGFISFIEKGDGVEDIIKDICTYLERDEVVDFKAIHKDEFMSRLKKLFEIDRIYYTAKATVLRQEHNHVFIQARAITDIRPIFKTNVEEAPIVGMIIHKLHVHYKSDDESNHKDIYFALDSKDVEDLKNLLIRAEKKEKALKGIFEKSQMSNLTE